jgi:hypothetical protein
MGPMMRALAVAAVLTRVSYRVQDGETAGMVKDSNGNFVGDWVIQ